MSKNYCKKGHEVSGHNALQYTQKLTNRWTTKDGVVHTKVTEYSGIRCRICKLATTAKSLKKNYWKYRLKRL